MKTRNLKNIPEISIIIPCYNSQKYISRVIFNVSNVLFAKKLEYEIICVTDGCTDNTERNAKKGSRTDDRVKVIGYKVNKGKGFAVRYGMKKAKGRIIGFIDADEEIYPENIVNLYNLIIDKNADVVVGSKWHKLSQVSYPLHRKFISYAFRVLTNWLFKLTLSDTQAGVKVFKNEVVNSILPELQINGFAFDVEMLVAAKRKGFSNIIEGPIVVNAAKSSDASLLKSFGILLESIKMFIDTFKLFFKLNVLKYNQ